MKAKQYFIKFYSGNKKRDSRRDLQMHIKLFGDRNQSKRFNLLNSKTHDIKFCENQVF